MNQKKREISKEEQEERKKKVKAEFERKYKILEKINAGAFGVVHRGLSLKNNEEVAIKLEPSTTKHPQLYLESKYYQYLNQDTTIIDKGVPNVYYAAAIDGYNMLVMDLLGPSLEELFTSCGRRFSVKTVLMLADQLIQRLEFIHKKNLLHRDVKPDNFLMGTGKKAHKVFIVDFGLAKSYKDKYGRHIEKKEGKNLTGTARYASINTHDGLEQGRRDDMESCGYMLMYFLRGQLPWQNQKAKDKKEKYQLIREKKKTTSIEQLCKGFPVEFGTYLTMCRNLKFEEEPDYASMRTLFRDLFKRSGYEWDYKYDWDVLSQERQQVQQQMKGMNLNNNTNNNNNVKK